MYSAFVQVIKFRYLLILGLINYTAIGIGNASNLQVEPGSYESFEKLSIYEKKLQELLGRVEILEHNTSLLQQQLNKLNKLEVTAINDSVSRASEQSQNSTISNSSESIVASNHSSTLTLAEREAYQQGLLTFKEAGVSKEHDKLLKAQRQFKQFLQNYPNSSLIANAYFWLGEISYRQEPLKPSDLKQAAQYYLKAYKIAKETNNSKAADALLKLALAIGGDGKDENKHKACILLKKLNDEFPPEQCAKDLKMQIKDANMKYDCNNCKTIKHD